VIRAPFGRMLVGQAAIEQPVLLTADSALVKFP
jgi:PIN domain nuclease of toxin-antitoxin system